MQQDRRGRGSGLHQRWHEDLRRRCLDRAKQQRQTAQQQARMSGSAKVAMLDSYRSIVHTELNMVNGRTSIVWGEGDDAQLQQQLGHDAYLELMTSTEEALLRELEVDLAYLGGDDQTGEYEAYMAHQELMAVASVEEAPLQNEDRVLCPLCLLLLFI